ncbi:CPBP family intramembrane metalloprotease [Rathayibacter sp. VKM Ac-2804]|uniref:CPBP family intramembrane glutamic endopeptidase n=1 Tax=Rathayibacter sp. VKM Ac-2804 TaxID=2609257 RepID=UPI00132E9A98|nr:CPBP family intramembrane glutamic endopeptidase [Rathayibacter sp. VKM Ac-2804]QHF24403.1 CPBP family intramembrane metalloprotease [Rathayibacter sp. VKM Ac-2804]
MNGRFDGQRDEQRDGRRAWTAWRRFWERGGFRRALLLAAVYYGLYELIGYLLGFVVGDTGSALHGEEGSATDVFFSIGLPILLASVLLVLFALSLGWLRELFATQTIRGRGWMWIGTGVILAINVSALLDIDYADAGGALVASWLLTGLFVGFAEETLTRGFVVNLMRKRGHGEIRVALASAGIFAALHIGNVFTSDQGVAVTALQVVYTFGFGIVMYLALRATGSLLGPILLHASTDPTLLLHAEHPAGTIAGLLPAFSTYLVIATGLILLLVLVVSERRRRRSALEQGATA